MIICIKMVAKILASRLTCTVSLLDKEMDYMFLNWALIFLVIALIAAIFGYSGIAAQSAGIAKILFIVFLVLFIVSFIMRLMRRSGPPPAP